MQLTTKSYSISQKAIYLEHACYRSIKGTHIHTQMSSPESNKMFIGSGETPVVIPSQLKYSTFPGNSFAAIEILCLPCLVKQG